MIPRRRTAARFQDDGRPLSPREIADERASVGVGMVFQQFKTCSANLTAKENVAGPLKPPGCTGALARVDADRRARRFARSRSVSAIALTAAPGHLSGGQQQRVAIARGAGTNPSVLLLGRADLRARSRLVNEVLE